MRLVSEQVTWWGSGHGAEALVERSRDRACGVGAAVCLPVTSVLSSEVPSSLLAGSDRRCVRFLIMNQSFPVGDFWNYVRVWQRVVKVLRLLAGGEWGGGIVCRGWFSVPCLPQPLWPRGCPRRSVASPRPSDHVPRMVVVCPT